MEIIQAIIICDGPTCKEFALKEGDSIPESWMQNPPHEKLHYHSEQCAILGELSQLFGPVQSSKGMTTGTYLRALADEIEPTQRVTKRLDKALQKASKSVGDAIESSNIAYLMAILEQNPGPHSTEDLVELSAKYGRPLTTTQISPALANSTNQARYPQLKVARQEREGQRTRNLYSVSVK